MASYKMYRQNYKASITKLQELCSDLVSDPVVVKAVQEETTGYHAGGQG